MLRALTSGVTGVKAHQTMLDVTGNNIANVNTWGYKRSVTNFQDLLYQNARGAAAPDKDAGRGGVNPMQIGLGVSVASVETIHSQGNVNYTGNRTDLAVQGDGYFIVKDGSNSYYTRSGVMTLDGQNNLVQSGTGYMLQGYGMSRDPNDPTQFVQDATLKEINIPIGQKMPARATTITGYRCNLDSRVDAHLPMGVTGQDVAMTVRLGTNSYILNNVTSGGAVGTFLQLGNGVDGITLPFTGVDATSGLPTFGPAVVAGFAGATAPVTAAYDSATGRLTISDGAVPPNTQNLELSGVMDFTPVTITQGGTTYRYLAEFNDLPSGDRELVLWGPNNVPAPTRFPLTLPVNADGTFRPLVAPNDIVIPAANSPTGLAITASVSANGRSVVLRNGTTDVTTLNQRTASVHDSKVDVFDSLGNAHTLEVSWEKIDNNQWRWRAWLPTEPGITLSNNTGVVNFTPQGLIEGTDTFDVGLAFATVGAEDATIRLDFSGRSFEEEPIEGITQYGSGFTTKAFYQDGYAMGVLRDFAVSPDGIVTGDYSNGKKQPLSKIALALFANPQGLEKRGESVFSESPNSGMAQVVGPQTGGAGKIAGSSLEMSNVDLSDEFVTLIKGQRGFQASARVVTTGDQVLEELINLKR